MSSPWTDPASPRAALALPANARVWLISDLHLSALTPATAAAWRAVLDDPRWSLLLLLGDVFEAWVGDDLLDEPGAAFERGCADHLRATAAARPVAFMHGNRDFLVGPRFAADTGVALLSDPCTLTLGAHRWLLSHGDALCLDDTDYQALRRTVRDPAWQQAVLARPLAERHALARQMRDASDARKSDSGPADWADVDTAAALDWLAAHAAPTLIHGHTHRPARHDLAPGRDRLVLSDWDFDDPRAPRGSVVELTAEGARRFDWPTP